MEGQAQVLLQQDRQFFFVIEAANFLGQILQNRPRIVGATKESPVNALCGMAQPRRGNPGQHKPEAHPYRHGNLGISLEQL